MKDINQIALDLSGGLTLEDLREKQNAPRRANVAQQSEEARQAEMSYWEKVFSQGAKKQSALIVVKSIKQEMDFEDAKRKFWAILQQRAEQIRQIEGNPAFRWTFTEEEQERVRQIIKYFINDKSSIFSLHKGLFIFGQNGTGKTEIMQAFSRFTIEYDLSKTFVFCSMSDIYNLTKSDKDYDPVTINTQFDRCFDEFGRYVGPVVRYGDSLDVNEAIIEARYSRHRNYGQLTHFISNMTPNEAENSFSPMVFDRLRSMCTSVEFTGNSKRL